MTFCKTNDVKAARSDILSWHRVLIGRRQGMNPADLHLRYEAIEIGMEQRGEVAMLFEP